MGWFSLVRAFWPSIVSTLAALAMMLALTPLRDSAGPFQQLFGVAALVPLAFLLFAFGYGSWLYYRFYQAERGAGPICNCGGPLGHERDGRYGDYRKCLACGRNVNNRHYS